MNVNLISAYVKNAETMDTFLMVKTARNMTNVKVGSVMDQALFLVAHVKQRNQREVRVVKMQTANQTTVNVAHVKLMVRYLMVMVVMVTNNA